MSGFNAGPFGPMMQAPPAMEMQLNEINNQEREKMLLFQNLLNQQGLNQQGIPGIFGPMLEAEPNRKMQMDMRMLEAEPRMLNIERRRPETNYQYNPFERFNPYGL